MHRYRCRCATTSSFSEVNLRKRSDKTILSNLSIYFDEHVRPKPKNSYPLTVTNNIWLRLQCSDSSISCLLFVISLYIRLIDCILPRHCIVVFDVRGAMLRCDRRQSSLVVGIYPAHWDQTFVGENDREPRRPADETPTRLCIQEFRYQNVAAIRQKMPINKRCSTETIGAEMEDDLGRQYVNILRCLDNLVVPQTAAGSVSLRMDLSPMSLRANAVDTTGGQSSAVVHVAVSRLKESGFYYGSISHSEARDLLQPHPPGTFLVRDSSHQRFLFSLTVRTSGIMPR